MAVRGDVAEGLRILDKLDLIAFGAREAID
jgi:hypothetical protein